MKKTYYGEILARSIMFSTDIHSFYPKLDYIISKMDVELSDVLEELFQMFLFYAECKYITNNSKSNIYMFMHYISRKPLGDKAYRIYRAYYGEVMLMLNDVKCDKNLEEFYRYEISARSNKPQQIITSQKIEREKQRINKSIEFDSEVLFNHLDEDDDTFDKRSINFVASPYYTESVRYLMNGYPKISDEPNFKNRVCMILEKRSNLKKRHRGFSLDKSNCCIRNMLARHDAKKLYKQVIGN